MRTVQHEWDYYPEPRQHPERRRTAAPRIELTIERQKPAQASRQPSLYWRVMSVYADVLIFAVKFLVGIVLCGFSFAAFWMLFTIIRVAFS